MRSKFARLTPPLSVWNASSNACNIGQAKNTARKRPVGATSRYGTSMPRRAARRPAGGGGASASATRTLGNRQARDDRHIAAPPGAGRSRNQQKILRALSHGIDQARRVVPRDPHLAGQQLLLHKRVAG